jgi:methionyl-tRNA formyltransferase
MGTPAFAVASLQSLIDDRFDIAAVVTQPDRPSGRGKRIQPPPVKVVADGYGIEVIQPENVRDAKFISRLSAIAPDVIAVVAYGQILPKTILALPPLGCINVHASLLPKYRGAAPINWCIIMGEKTTGVTTMYMDAGMDTGDIIYSQSTDIAQYETAGMLHDRLARLGGDLLVKTLHSVCAGTAPRVPQDHSGATYAPQLKKNDGLIDWTNNAECIINLIRGTDPWPGAFSYYSGRLMKIWKAMAVQDEGSGRPGTITRVTPEGMLVKAGQGSVLVHEIQMPSSRRMTIAEYIRGNSITPGKVLGDISDY